MAEWWELAIPAGSTLAGGLLGSMMQARNSERQAQREAGRAERQTRAQMGRDTRVKYYTERRQAYSDYCKAVYDASAAGHDLEDARRRLADRDLGEARDRVVEVRDRAFQGLAVAAQQLRTAHVQVLLVGSEELEPLTNEIADEVALVMHGQGNLSLIQDHLQEFLSAARAELSEALATPPSSSEVLAEDGAGGT